jgi:tetratricopeptide (TPR) repeat protein
MKITGLKVFGVAMAGLLVLSAASFAQGMGGQQGSSGSGMGGQQPPPQQTPPAQGQATPPATPPPVDPAEEAAFKKLAKVDNADANAVSNQASSFLNKYPNSKYAAQVYAQLAGAYMQLDQADKALVAGKKSLELSNNTNVDALAVMAVVTSRRFDTKNKTQQAQAADLAATEAYGRQGIQLLTALVKPAEADEATFTKTKNQRLAMCYSGLGLALWNEGKYAEAAQNFAEATKLENPPEPVDLYLLGLASMETKQFAQAMTAFTDCVKEAGQMQGMDGIQTECKTKQAEARKQAAAQVTPPKQ